MTESLFDRFLSRCWCQLERLSTALIYVGGGLLIVCCLLVAVEVVIRKTLNQSLQGVDEISGYFFAVFTVWAFSYALFRRAHVRVDALYLHLPSGIQRILDIVALLSMAIIFTLLSYQAWGVLAETVRIGAQSNTPLRTPLWIPQVFWMMGLWLFALNIWIVLTRSVLALLRGDMKAVEAMAAAPSIHEETRDDVETARAEAEQARS
ncbi:TRAP transporter small permease subunit [Shumkonia mesophila]|uniref:TRAP transporter small permease subunit n=1 Tax=Shumkonia mesophila TaxID=2838854 RepID=UPI002934775A|nr:TRAP transporter small permease [Shumkonia mesophila]